MFCVIEPTTYGSKKLDEIDLLMLLVLPSLYIRVLIIFLLFFTNFPLHGLQYHRMIYIIETHDHRPPQLPYVYL